VRGELPLLSRQEENAQDKTPDEEPSYSVRTVRISHFVLARGLIAGVRGSAEPSSVDAVWGWQPLQFRPRQSSDGTPARAVTLREVFAVLGTFDDGLLPGAAFSLVDVRVGLKDPSRDYSVRRTPR